jgi:hypothetical protein
MAKIHVTILIIHLTPFPFYQTSNLKLKAVVQLKKLYTPNLSVF